MLDYLLDLLLWNDKVSSFDSDLSSFASPLPCLTKARGLWALWAISLLVMNTALDEVAHEESLAKVMLLVWS